MITASMVLYHNPAEQFAPVIRAFLAADPEARLVVVDNSARALECELFKHERVVYLHPGRNLGFGCGHNLGFRRLPDSEFHLLLNPDVRFEPGAVRELLRFAASDPSIGAVMPRICFPNGSLQRLCKLLPTPMDLVLRRFVPVPFLWERRRAAYELDGLPQDRISDVPFLSSCFLLLRSSLFRELGGFDERYFMYMEDVDLARRIGDRARTVYYPFVSIQHEYGKGSYKSSRLLGYHLMSALKYFSKWGWWFDPARSERNAAALRQIARTSRAG